MLYFYRGLRDVAHQSARINNDDDDDDDEILTKGGLLTDIKLQLVALFVSVEYYASGSWQLQ